MARKKISIARALPKDYPLFLLVILTVIFLMVVLLAFYVFASASFKKNNFSLPLPDQGRYAVEMLNYHGYQAPRSFPIELLKGKVGNFNSSQEVKYEGQGVVSYVSFQSSISTESLIVYYSNYLFKQAFVGSVSSYDDKSAQIVANRDKQDYKFIIKPTDDGSMVSIYQVVVK